MPDPLSTRSDGAPWECQPVGSDGYFCVKGPDGPLIQGEAQPDRREIHVSGDSPLVIDKMFGPLIFFPLRVTASIDTGEWVVERLSGGGDEWHEVARIPGQTAEDFEADD